MGRPILIHNQNFQHAEIGSALLLFYQKQHHQTEIQSYDSKTLIWA